MDPFSLQGRSPAPFSTSYKLV